MCSSRGGSEPDRDQDAAQMIDRLAGGQRVEGVVGEAFAGVQVAQDGRGGPVEPGCHGVGSVCRGKSVVQGPQVCRDLTVLSAQHLMKALSEGAAGASPLHLLCHFERGRLALPVAARESVVAERQGR
jgi:hypothetical protein